MHDTMDDKTLDLLWAAIEKHVYEDLSFDDLAQIHKERLYDEYKYGSKEEVLSFIGEIK